MYESFIGYIALFGFNFAPKGWSTCAGQLLPISQYSALFSLLGTTYGGDGRTTFALPDLRGRVAIGMSNNYLVGQVGGSSEVTLLQNQLPAHSHFMTASTNGPTQNTASGASLASADRSTAMENIYTADGANNVNMGSVTSAVGGNQAHSNMQPYLGLNYCICMIGIFPSRN